MFPPGSPIPRYSSTREAFQRRRFWRVTRVRIEFFDVTHRILQSNQQICHPGRHAFRSFCTNNHGYRSNPRGRTFVPPREFQSPSSPNDEIRGYLRLPRKNPESLESRHLPGQNERHFAASTRSVIASLSYRKKHTLKYREHVTDSIDSSG